jgi:hypothetical protein
VSVPVGWFDDGLAAGRDAGVVTGGVWVPPELPPATVVEAVGVLGDGLSNTASTTTARVTMINPAAATPPIISTFFLLVSGRAAGKPVPGRESNTVAPGIWTPWVPGGYAWVPLGYACVPTGYAWVPGG